MTDSTYASIVLVPIYTHRPIGLYHAMLRLQESNTDTGKQQSLDKYSCACYGRETVGEELRLVTEGCYCFPFCFDVLELHHTE